MNFGITMQSQVTDRFSFCKAIGSSFFINFHIIKTFNIKKLEDGIGESIKHMKTSIKKTAAENILTNIKKILNRHIRRPSKK